MGPLLGVWVAGLSSPATPFLITGIMYALYGIFLLVILNRYEMKQKRLGSNQQIRTILRAVIQDQKLLLFIAGGILITVGYSQFDSTLPQFINMNVEDGVKLFSYVIVANSITVLAFQLPLTVLSEKFQFIVH